MDNSLLFIIIFCGIFLLLGFVFLLIGILTIHSRKMKEKKCTLKTFGKITDLVRHDSYSNDHNTTSSWHPVFEYNIGNLKFVKESLYGSFQSKFAIGQTVEIHYNPEDYNDYYVSEELLPKKMGNLFTIIGIIMLSIVVIAFIIYFIIF